MQLLQLYLLTIIGLVFFSIGLSGAADCVGIGIAKSIVVDQNGRGNFKTVQDAIDSVPSGNSRWVKISINSGTYQEKVKIPQDKPCIFLEGKGRHVTTIAYDAHASTDSSVTFSSYSENVVVQGISFKNSYNRFWTNALPGVTQAVAARVDGDKTFFYSCGFLGVQDTMWDEKGRHYYESCYIEGAIDFIFGNGQSYFEVRNSSSYIGTRITGQYIPEYATIGMEPYNLQRGYVTAQKRESASETTGFVFKGGRVLSGNGEVFLGRAYGKFSRVVFIETLLSPSISPLGWDAWRNKGYEDNMFYSEVNCGGAGSNKSKRVPWIKDLDKSHVDQYYSRSGFIDHDGWLARQPLAPKMNHLPN